MVETRTLHGYVNGISSKECNIYHFGAFVFLYLIAHPLLSSTKDMCKKLSQKPTYAG